MVADVDRSQRQVVELRSRLRRPARLLAEVREDVAAGRRNLAPDRGRDRRPAAHRRPALLGPPRGERPLQRPARRRLRPRLRRPRPRLRRLRPPVEPAHRGAPPRLPRRARRRSSPDPRSWPAPLPCATPTSSGSRTSTSPSPSAAGTATPAGPGTASTSRCATPTGNRVLYFEGNWRDIFQNWEALSLSYPEFVENIIAKFVNASTVDGHNPYRITKDGIDWEVPDPGHPWSTIGYWGDHQIIYLLRLLELSLDHHPERLRALLERDIFSYADVPYEIVPFAEIVREPSLHHPLRRGEGRADPGALRGAGLGRQAPAGRRRGRARRARREAAGGRAGQARQLRAGRRDLAQHPAPGVERRQQRAGRATACRW